MDTVDGYAFLMAFSTGFYGNSGCIHGHSRSILNASPNAPTMMTSITNSTNGIIGEPLCLSMSVTRFGTEEIKKTVNETMDSVVN